MAPTPANLTRLHPGYYRVRKDTHWQVARWRPSESRWTTTFGATFVPLYFDEIAEKVA
jgi:hypothetical protein